MKITNTITNHPRKFALLISCLTMLLYFSSTPSVNVGYGDSDEFLVVGNNWGLAHPPGYSLYTSFLKIASIIKIPYTNSTQRMHAVSGLSAGIAVYFLLIFLFEIQSSQIIFKKKSDKQLSLVATFISIITLISSNLFWLYAQIAEKYIFSTPFIALLLLLGFRLLYNPKSSLKTLIVFGLTYGILLAHHQSMVFILPYILFIAWQAKSSTRFSRISLMIGSSLLGLFICLSLVVIQMHRSVEPSWNIKSGVNGFINFILRKDFQGNLYRINTSTSGYIPQQLTLSQITTSLLNYFYQLFSSTYWWTILPILISITLLIKKSKQMLITFTLPPVLLGICLAIYLNWPADLGSQAATVRFYIPSLITWIPLIYIGLYEMLSRLFRFIHLLGVSINLSKTIVSSLMILPLICLIITYPHISLKHFNLISRLYSQILTEIKPNSLITCYSDISCFALLYEKSVNHLRPDVDIVPLAFPLVKNEIEAKKLAGFTYPNNPYLMMDILTWNLGQRPVYTADISPYYFNFFGFDNGFLSYNPSGYSAEITHQMPNTFSSNNYQLSTDYISYQTPKFDLMRRYLIQSLSQIHISNGYVWLKIGDRPRAQTEFSLGVNLAYQLSESEKKSAQDNRSQLERTMSSPNYAPGMKTATADKLISYLPDLFSHNFNSQAFNIARGAVIADPRNIQARLELAKIFQKMGDQVFSKREFQHVLLIDPQNKEALQAIDSNPK